jgi:hypothetical protein
MEFASSADLDKGNVEVPAQLLLGHDGVDEGDQHQQGDGGLVEEASAPVEALEFIRQFRALALAGGIVLNLRSDAFRAHGSSYDRGYKSDSFPDSKVRSPE